MKGVSVISIAATAVIGALAVGMFDVPGAVLQRLDERHDERASRMFVSVQFYERQEFNRQVENLESTINRNELEMARPGTTDKEKAIYRRQNKETLQKRERLLRDWEDRHR